MTPHCIFRNRGEGAWDSLHAFNADERDLRWSPIIPPMKFMNQAAATRAVDIARKSGIPLKQIMVREFVDNPVNPQKLADNEIICNRFKYTVNLDGTADWITRENLRGCVSIEKAPKEARDLFDTLLAEAEAIESSSPHAFGLVDSDNAEQITASKGPDWFQRVWESARSADLGDDDAGDILSSEADSLGIDKDQYPTWRDVAVAMKCRRLSTKDLSDIITDNKANDPTVKAAVDEITHRLYCNDLDPTTFVSIVDCVNAILSLEDDGRATDPCIVSEHEEYEELPEEYEQEADEDYEEWVSDEELELTDEDIARAERSVHEHRVEQNLRDLYAAADAMLDLARMVLNAPEHDKGHAKTIKKAIKYIGLASEQALKTLKESKKRKLA